MSWQKKVRSLFPICEQQVYLDEAFGNGGCKASMVAMEKFFEEQFSGRAEGKKRWNEATEETRQLISQLLGGVDTKNIAFTKNTVEGINIIAQAFPWQAGDKVLLNDQEHTSNLMPWLALKQRGVICDVIKASNYSLPVEELEAAMDEHTRIVAISHVQSATGYRCDLQRLAEICHQRGIFLVVDAIQSLGLCPCDANEWGVDAIAAGGHKSLLAVPGVGILYVSPALLAKLRPLYAGSSAVCSIDREQWINAYSDETMAQKLELSNLNYPGIYALREGLKLILEIGVENIWAHVSALSAKLNAALREIGYEVVTSAEQEHQAGIVSVSVKDPLGMKEWFAQRGITISKMDAGYVRFSLGAYTNEIDVDKAIEAAREYYYEQK